MRRTRKQKGGNMAEAQRIIDEWVAEGDVNKELLINNLKLTSLPPLPENLKILFCENNNLTELPDLPDTLIDLFCANNKLTSLPTLPANLDTLACINNNLTKIPTLPKKLRGLSCTNNKLTRLPDLPMSLLYLDCEDNKLPKEYYRNIALGDEDFDSVYSTRYITRLRKISVVDELEYHITNPRREKFALNIGTDPMKHLNPIAIRNTIKLMNSENMRRIYPDNNINSLKPSEVELNVNKVAAEKRSRWRERITKKKKKNNNNKNEYLY
jgi:hypothetical protein